MKKIIAYSLYGSDPLYLEGALRNAELCETVFSGWTCRFYVSQEIPEDLILKLKILGAEIVKRHRSDHIDGMFWRFEPASETGLTAMIVRDTDSRLTTRDKDCVDEWLASDKQFHFLRDHPSQRKPILGGLWGCRGNAVPDIKKRISAWKKKSLKGNDQHFLLHSIYPQASKDCYIQSPFTQFGNETVHPISSPRSSPWEYLGRPVDINKENAPPCEADDIVKSLSRPLRTFKLPISVRFRKLLA